MEDYYLSLELGYEYSLSETTTLALGGSVGLAGEDFAAFYAGGTDGGFFNYTLTAGISYALTEAWTVGAASACPTGWTTTPCRTRRWTPPSTAG